MNHRAEPERQVGNEVFGRKNLQDRQLGDRGQGMREEVKRSGTGPCTFDDDVTKLRLALFRG